MVGLGLIGGSLALAVRRFLPEVEVVGVDVDGGARALARERRAVGRACARLREGIPGADLIVLAVPVEAISGSLPRVAELASPDALVTDTGSTKLRICRVGWDHLGTRFLGGHPLTGSEARGLAAADPFLFENAFYALTPSPQQAESDRTQGLKGFLEALGAQVVLLDPAEHDRIAAAVSHLPQLVAVALCDLVRERAEANPWYRELAAGGFRDLTRVAASPFSLWRSILASNAEEVDRALEALQDRIGEIRRELRTDTLQARFGRASAFRRGLAQRAKGFLIPLHRVSVILEDRPGALAQALNALADGEINLKDLELIRVREGVGGTFHLYLESPTEAERATALLRRIGLEAHVIG